MSLLKTFSTKTIRELVIILESGDDYTSTAKEAAVTILELRDINQEELTLQAKNYWKDILNSDIKKFLLNKTKPISTLLTDDEISELFRDAFDKWKENQKTFEIDTTKYWFV